MRNEVTRFEGGKQHHHSCPCYFCCQYKYNSEVFCPKSANESDKHIILPHQLQHRREESVSCFSCCIFGNGESLGFAWKRGRSLELEQFRLLESRHSSAKGTKGRRTASWISCADQCKDKIVELLAFFAFYRI
jgi:hypothetical protein